MVNIIDIHKLTVEELSGVVALYPWYAAARVEYCRRMAEMGAVSESQLSQTALYVATRRILFDMVHDGRHADCSDKDARQLVESCIKEPQPEERRVIVAGGDYFSPAQYSNVRRTEDGIFSKFASKAKEEGGSSESEPETVFDFCTETLAKIYLEQDYKEEAIDIYSKLSLRYPEKSIYFAALIKEIKQQ